MMYIYIDHFNLGSFGNSCLGWHGQRHEYQASAHSLGPRERNQAVAMTADSSARVYAVGESSSHT